METTLQIVQHYTITQTNHFAEVVQKMGNVPKQRELLKSIDRVQTFAQSLIKNAEQHLPTEDWQEMANHYGAYGQYLSTLDTSLQDFRNRRLDYVPHRLRSKMFQKIFLLNVENRIARAESKASEVFFGKLWYCGMRFSFIQGKALPDYRIQREGEIYHATILFPMRVYVYHAKCDLENMNSNFTMFDNIGEITIPYQPIKFDTNGLSKQQLNGQITFRKSYKDTKDTTIYLSTTYTVKRKK
jgi:hypothetical protein